MGISKTWAALFVMIVVSCNHSDVQQDSDTASPIDGLANSSYHTVLVEKEKAYSVKQNGHIGTLLTTIPFEVRTDDTREFDNGIIPWAKIEKPEKEISRLINRNEIVVPKGQVTVIIDYPLTNSYQFELESEYGLTRAQILKDISRVYLNLYEEEEQTATIKTIPVDKRTTTYNRNQTNGKYGIWGHDIADLVISEVLVYKTQGGKIVLVLVMQS